MFNALAFLNLLPHCKHLNTSAFKSLCANSICVFSIFGQTWIAESLASFGCFFAAWFITPCLVPNDLLQNLHLNVVVVDLFSIIFIFFVKDILRLFAALESVNVAGLFLLFFLFIFPFNFCLRAGGWFVFDNPASISFRLRDDVFDVELLTCEFTLLWLWLESIIFSYKKQYASFVLKSYLIS